MKIRMLTQISGTRNGESWPAVGELHDLPEDEAIQMCAAGLAEPVAEPEKRQTADVKPHERRARRTAE